MYLWAVYKTITYVKIQNQAKFYPPKLELATRRQATFIISFIISSKIFLLIFTDWLQSFKPDFTVSRC